MRVLQVVALWMPIALLGLAAPAESQPVDLREQRARPVWMSLEISPALQPAGLDQQYSERHPAWFEPGPGPGRATIRVAGAEMERLLAGYDPVPGSFSDYVWTFDVETGQVLSATLDGTLRQRLDWGFLSTRVRADISARLSTLTPAGFQPPHSRFGHVLFESCSVGEAGCTLVAPHPYDRETGYVNAVGAITARAVGGITTRTFCPLGEAVFSEMRTDTSVSAR